MKASFIVNGRLQLILSPSSEIEKELLRQLSQNPIGIQIYEKIQTGLDSHMNAVVITNETDRPRVNED